MTLAMREKRVTNVGREIAEFCNRDSILTPTKQPVPLLSGINDLQMALVRTNIQVAQLAMNTPKNPLILELQRRAKVLQDQIDQARTQVTGPGTSLVPKSLRSTRWRCSRVLPTSCSAWPCNPMKSPGSRQSGRSFTLRR